MPRGMAAELREIRNIAERTLGMVSGVSNIVAKTLKSSRLGYDRDLMLIIITWKQQNTGFYNPDYNEHNRQG